MPYARVPRDAVVRDHLAADRGQDTIEWVLIAFLLSVAAATFILVLGDNISRGYTDVEECISLAAGTGRGPPPERPDGGRGPPQCRL